MLDQVQARLAAIVATPRPRGRLAGPPDLLKLRRDVIEARLADAYNERQRKRYGLPPTEAIEG